MEVLSAPATALATEVAKVALNKTAQYVRGKRNKQKSPAVRGGKKGGNRTGKKTRPTAPVPRRVPREIKAAPIPVREGFVRPRTHFTQRITRVGGKDAMRFSGCDYYGNIYSLSGATQFNKIAEYPLNPLALPQTRLAIESQLWIKYKFNSVRVHYVPIKSTATDGLLLFSHIDDPELTLPQPGTTAYVESLMQPPGMKVTPVYSKCVMSWNPSKTDKREFYIHPDRSGNETRFTIQSILSTTLLYTPSTATTFGAVFIEYDVTLYDKAIAQSPAFGQVAVRTSVPTITTVQFNDPGFNAALGFSTANANPVYINALWAVYFNFSCGDMQAMTIYYVKPLVNGSPVSIYDNAYDAENASTDAGILTGSVWGLTLPSNATCFFILASSMPSPTKTTAVIRDEEYNAMVERFKVMQAQLNLLMKNNNDESDEEPEITTPKITNRKPRSDSPSHNPTSKRGVG